MRVRVSRQRREVKSLGGLHVEAHHEGPIRVGRTRERFCQNIAAVLSRFHSVVVESPCRHVLVRVVVLEPNVLCAGPVTRVADDGLRAGRIREDRRRVLLGEPQLTEEVAEKDGLRTCVTYSDSGVECATVEMVYDFQETAAPPIRKT